MNKLQEFGVALDELLERRRQESWDIRTLLTRPSAVEEVFGLTHNEPDNETPNNDKENS